MYCLILSYKKKKMKYCPILLFISIALSFSAYGIFAKRIIQCRSQFGPFYGPVKSTEKAPPRKPVISEENEEEKEKPASPKESADKQNDIAIVKPETHNLITTEESQMKDNEIHKQLNQQQLSVPVPEIIQQNQENTEQLMLQNMQGYSSTPDLNMQSQIVSQHYAQNNETLSEDSGYLTSNVTLQQHSNLDKATQEQILNIQNSLHPSPYSDGGIQHLQGYTPQQALDIVTTMSNVPNQTVGQFNQGQLPMNQDLTLQASIEAGIAPPDSYVNGAGMTETQLLEHSIAVAQQELQNMTSEPLTSMPTSNMANRSTIETTSHTSTEQLTMLKEEQITSEQISSEDIHTEHVLSQPQSVDTADIQGEEGKNNEDTSEKESPNVPDTSKDYTYEIKVNKWENGNTVPSFFCISFEMIFWYFLLLSHV